METCARSHLHPCQLWICWIHSDANFFTKRDKRVEIPECLFPMLNHQWH